MTRLLLIEDDPTIRRYVVLALEDEGLERIDEAGTLAAALDRLRNDSYDVVLTDLMLPDGHGTDLLEALRDDPGLRGGARLVAFSAGIASSMRQRLCDLGVEQILEKPVSLQALIDGVRTLSPTPAGESPLSGDPEAAAIESHFGGQRSLFLEFREASQRQFAADVEHGDGLLSGEDTQALRRLAHSLKSVLRLLGRPEAAARAAALEDAAQQPGATMASLREAWRGLRQDLA